MKALYTLFEKQKEINAPDLHLFVGAPPYFRMTNGNLSPIVGMGNITASQTEDLAKSILSKEDLATFQKNKDFDVSRNFGKYGRFRINFFYNIEGISLDFRKIEDKVLSIDELKLPEALKSLAHEKNGLILFAGPNGSGKSTSMAALLSEINNTRNCNIVTIEDPIEYVYKSNKSVISQREVGTHVGAFADAGKYLFRQDVDVVVIGEIRDYDSFALALDIVESGHLLISTMHAESATAAISRIIGIFPHEKQNLIRTKLAISLRSIIAQKLITTKDNKSRVLATEVLMNVDIVKNAIISGDIGRIRSIIESKQSEGSYGFNKSILDLLKKDLISKESAIMSVEHHEEFQNMLLRKEYKEYRNL